MMDGKMQIQDGTSLATIDVAINAATEVFNATREEILGDKRHQRIAKARHAIVLCGRKTLQESFPTMADALTEIIQR